MNLNRGFESHRPCVFFLLSLLLLKIYMHRIRKKSIKLKVYRRFIKNINFGFIPKRRTVLVVGCDTRYKKFTYGSNFNSGSPLTSIRRSFHNAYRKRKGFLGTKGYISI